MIKSLKKCIIPVVILIACFLFLDLSGSAFNFKTYLSNVSAIKEKNSEIDSALQKDYVAIADSNRPNLVSLTDKVGILKSITSISGVSDYSLGSYDVSGNIKEITKDFSEDITNLRFIQVTVKVEDANAFLDSFNVLRIPASKIMIEPLNKSIVLQIDFKMGGQF